MMKSTALATAALGAALLFPIAAQASTPASQAGSPNSTAAATGPNEVALTWAPEYMSPTHQFTQAQAVAIAQRFDTVAAMPVAFQNYVGAMRTANPNLELLAYSNAMYASKPEYAGLSEAAF